MSCLPYRFFFVSPHKHFENYGIVHYGNVAPVVHATEISSARYRTLSYLCLNSLASWTAHEVTRSSEHGRIRRVTSGRKCMQKCYFVAEWKVEGGIVLRRTL